ncbi:hypothetical protein D3C80_252540 [compost metagenome]
MRTVDVSIRHDDDLVVAQLVRIETVRFVFADRSAEGCDQRADLIGRDHAVKADAFHVEDLTAQRQNSLVLA